MKIHYVNVDGRLDEFAQTVSDALEGWTIDDLGDERRVGDFLMNADGDLMFSDRTDTEFVETVLEALDAAGFEFTEPGVLW